ncbi:carbamoyltransferase HypF [Xanthobacter oligotrophicus]|uniref:carbamoyltransferase HypF n=1 Tax=Xanthobacter oligotrophicus TaxID=2607286 RepID=UPI0011F1AAF4|nr:carbamoyltransferase HypF [Xanthobacter oligotrophicus]MCG5235452.1 carbamoyltransferase HypF [Xanthobacter oligotrophicus]
MSKEVTGTEVAGEKIEVSGIVQGVGFRPFVYRLARRLDLNGDVRNAGDRVVIRIAGPAAARDAFAAALVHEAPVLARVEQIVRRPAQVPEGAFRIVESGAGAVSVGVVPDVATCPACRAEITDPKARRYRYAFTNCTDCGPRFSIVTGLPYDRPATTMAGFPMCPACRAEYEDPADRRFHAQPIACTDCGPRLWLEGDGDTSADPIERAAALLRARHILAVKGLGGFHIACDATNADAVALLRARKHRPTKPLAVMADLAAAHALCHIAPEEEAALSHPSAPILLLPLKPGAPLAPGIAPGQRHLGVMLPYTPLHHLLLAAVGRPLVMTSGNRSSEPQIFRDDEARECLAGIVDAFLMHDRPIARRLDDSVARHVAGRQRIMRRGRGLAPMPLTLPADFADTPPVLALGGELKSALCLTHGGKALLSHHLGDLDEPATGDAFETALADYTALFAHRPAVVAVDLHPDYRATRLGEDLAATAGLPLERVQHHHAHMAAAMAEAGWRRADGPVVGIALDGLGLGADGTVWGAEILVCDYRTSRRVARLSPIPLAGGDAASREPWRVLLAHLDRALGRSAVDGDPRLAALFAGKPLLTLRAMMDKGLNAPLASSAGRLFDAVAALLGLAPDRLSHEGEAAMALEAAAEGEAPPYPFALRADGWPFEIDPAPLFKGLVADLHAGRPRAAMAAAFHTGLAEAFTAVAAQVATAEGLTAVALSGGVFQNARLLEETVRHLEARGLTPLVPSQVPANDGGLAFGQAVVAAARRMG